MDSVVKATGLDHATVAMLNGSDEDVLTEQAAALAAAMLQSTRPRGARHVALADVGGVQDVSIHAPARGATEQLKLVLLRLVVSIHAPARGATRPVAMRPRALGGFNPRAREGRDQSEAKAKQTQAVSTHAPARGATLPSRFVFRKAHVSIHAPARGATGRHFYFSGYPAVSTHAPARGATIVPVAPVA